MLKMLLVVDIGNTNVNFGLFDKDVLLTVAGYSHERRTDVQIGEAMVSSLFSNYKIDECVISSVYDEYTDVIRTAIINVFHINGLVINSGLNLGIKIDTEDPSKCGTDRIANAYAASKLYEQRPIIVVDSGSATTFDVIDKEGKFIGGLIMPGLQMQLDALSSNTSKLPKIDINKAENIDKVISNDTENNILSGVVQGHAQAVQGLIVKCERELRKKAFVIGTGGGAKLLQKFMRYKKFDVLDEHLTLKGIKMIYDLNI